MLPSTDVYGTEVTASRFSFVLEFLEFRLLPHTTLYGKAHRSEANLRGGGIPRFLAGGIFRYAHLEARSETWPRKR